MSKLSEELIIEFQKIMKEEKGLNLTFEEAEKLGTSLTKAMVVLHKADRKKFECPRGSID